MHLQELLQEFTVLTDAALCAADEEDWEEVGRLIGRRGKLSKHHDIKQAPDEPPDSLRQLIKKANVKQKQLLERMQAAREGLGREITGLNMKKRNSARLARYLTGERSGRLFSDKV